jgi:acetoin utilization deacetylase AcuC-like enzyme
MARSALLSRRFLRRLRRLFCKGRTSFVYHSGYEYVLAGVPFDPLRGQRILAFLYDEGLISASDLTRPIPASMHNISRVHSAEYLDSLDSSKIIQSILGFGVEEEQWQTFLDVQRVAAGGTIQATRLAIKQGSAAVNLCGGFHHAMPDRGIGFCTFNDIAIAVARLRAKGFDDPVLIVDLDVHDGNGTRAFFAEDPTVHTFSIHNETWNSDGAVADTCIAMGPNVSDDRFLETLGQELPPLIVSHRPGLS